jgi:hypothetical protein
MYAVCMVQNKNEQKKERRMKNRMKSKVYPLFDKESNQICIAIDVAYHLFMPLCRVTTTRAPSCCATGTIPIPFPPYFYDSLFTNTITPQQPLKG